MAILGPEIDASGGCRRHPYVQLQRLSSRTGQWLVLLESCPICQAEDESTVAGSRFSATGSLYGEVTSAEGRQRNAPSLPPPPAGTRTGTLPLPPAGTPVDEPSPSPPATNTTKEKAAAPYSRATSPGNDAVAPFSPNFDGSSAVSSLTGCTTMASRKSVTFAPLEALAAESNPYIVPMQSVRSPQYSIVLSRVGKGRNSDHGQKNCKGRSGSGRDAKSRDGKGSSGNEEGKNDKPSVQQKKLLAPPAPPSKKHSSGSRGDGKSRSSKGNYTEEHGGGDTSCARQEELPAPPTPPIEGQRPNSGESGRSSSGKVIASSGNNNKAGSGEERNGTGKKLEQQREKKKMLAPPAPPGKVDNSSRQPKGLPALPAPPGKEHTRCDIIHSPGQRQKLPAPPAPPPKAKVVPGSPDVSRSSITAGSSMQRRLTKLGLPKESKARQITLHVASADTLAAGNLPRMEGKVIGSNDVSDERLMERMRRVYVPLSKNAAQKIKKVNQAPPPSKDVKSQGSNDARGKAPSDFGEEKHPGKSRPERKSEGKVQSEFVEEKHPRSKIQLLERKSERVHAPPSKNPRSKNVAKREAPGAFGEEKHPAKSQLRQGSNKRKGAVDPRGLSLSSDASEHKPKRTVTKEPRQRQVSQGETYEEGGGKSSSSSRRRKSFTQEATSIISHQVPTAGKKNQPNLHRGTGCEQRKSKEDNSSLVKSSNQGTSATLNQACPLKSSQCDGNKKFSFSESTLVCSNAGQGQEGHNEQGDTRDHEPSRSKYFNHDSSTIQATTRASKCSGDAAEVERPSSSGLGLGLRRSSSHGHESADNSKAKEGKPRRSRSFHQVTSAKHGDEKKSTSNLGPRLRRRGSQGRESREPRGSKSFCQVEPRRSKSFCQVAPAPRSSRSSARRSKSFHQECAKSSPHTSSPAPRSPNCANEGSKERTRERASNEGTGNCEVPALGSSSAASNSQLSKVKENPPRRSKSFSEIWSSKDGPTSPSSCSCHSNLSFDDVAAPTRPDRAQENSTAGKNQLANFNSRNNNYDSKGRCVHHPNNQLRKRKILGGSKRSFGGWKVLMQACPDCCLEEMRRINSSQDKAGNEYAGQEGLKGYDEERYEVEKYKKGFKKGAGDDQQEHREHPKKSPKRSNSSGTASTALGSSESSDGSDLPSVQASTAVRWDTTFAVNTDTTQMEYNDIHGRHGYYTGSVNDDCFPHGHGTMVYDDGSKVAGTWKDGRMVRGLQEGKQVGSSSRRSRGRSSSRGRIGSDKSRRDESSGDGTPSSSRRRRSESRRSDRGSRRRSESGQKNDAFEGKAAVDGSRHKRGPNHGQSGSHLEGQQRPGASGQREQFARSA